MFEIVTGDVLGFVEEENELSVLFPRKCRHKVAYGGKEPGCFVRRWNVGRSMVCLAKKPPHQFTK